MYQSIGNEAYPMQAITKHSRRGHQWHCRKIFKLTLVKR
jgi:hypothetical protein